MTSVGVMVDNPIIIKKDNEGDIGIAKDPVEHTRAKQIGVLFHFLHDIVTHSDIELEYCATENMTADTLTKPVSKNKFVKCRDELGLKVYTKN